MDKVTAGFVGFGEINTPRDIIERKCAEARRLLEAEGLAVAWTDPVSRAFGEIKADLESRGLRLEDFDVAVAAHALANDAILVTDDLEHMGRISGLRTENWLR